MMKKLIIGFSILTSFNAFAISDQNLAKACLDKGKEKIKIQAQAWGCQVDLNDVEVSEIDNRWYTPSKYVWYEVRTECNGFDRITQLVQLYRGKCL
jgi:hypothetical protein